MPKKHIMVVDDYPTNLLLILRALEGEYRISCVETGRECLTVMASDIPDLILMDVRMPDMDGYECCRAIKDNFEYHQIPVIFLSAHTDIDDKLKGYDAGGDDYLTKPCEIPELMVKVAHNLQVVAEFQGMIKEANAFARMAMTNTGELGAVLQFMESSFECDDQSALADLILTTLQSYDFNACVQLRGSEETLNLSMMGSCSPLEESLMTAVVGGEKITEFGRRNRRRCLCSSKNISVLIKNLPMEDEALSGRLKDHVISILNGATARMDNLNLAVEKEQQVVNRIKLTLKDIEEALFDIEELSEKKNNQIADILAGLNEDMIKAFTNLALTEEQENHFMSLLNDRSDQLFKATASGGNVKTKFAQIKNKLLDIIFARVA